MNVSDDITQLYYLAGYNSVFSQSLPEGVVSAKDLMLLDAAFDKSDAPTEISSAGVSIFCAMLGFVRTEYVGMALDAVAVHQLQRTITMDTPALGGYRGDVEKYRFDLLCRQISSARAGFGGLFCDAMQFGVEFLRLSPFAGGNGRVAMLLLTALLLRAHINMVEQIPLSSALAAHAESLREAACRDVPDVARFAGIVASSLLAVLREDGEAPARAEEINDSAAVSGAADAPVKPAVASGPPVKGEVIQDVVSSVASAEPEAEPPAVQEPVDSAGLDMPRAGSKLSPSAVRQEEVRTEQSAATKPEPKAEPPVAVRAETKPAAEPQNEPYAEQGTVPPTEQKAESPQDKKEHVKAPVPDSEEPPGKAVPDVSGEVEASPPRVLDEFWRETDDMLQRMEKGEDISVVQKWLGKYGDNMDRVVRAVGLIRDADINRTRYRLANLQDRLRHLDAGESNELLGNADRLLRDVSKAIPVVRPAKSLGKLWADTPGAAGSQDTAEKPLHEEDQTAAEKVQEVAVDLVTAGSATNGEPPLLSPYEDELLHAGEERLAWNAIRELGPVFKARELGDILGLNRGSTLYAHLWKLGGLGLLTKEGSGKTVHYELTERGRKVLEQDGRIKKADD